LTSRGVSLVEALTATLLSSALAVWALGAVTSLQRRVEQHGQRAALGMTLAATGQLVRAELANLSPREGDIATPAPDGLAYRAVRGNGVWCGVAVDGGVARTASWRSLRLPAAGRDTILWLSRGPGDTLRWQGAALTGPARAAPCGDGAAGLALPIGRPMDTNGLINAPVRLVEVMELRAYISGGETWLGLRSVSAGEAIQPAAGPFAAGGVRFRHLNVAGADAGAPAEIARIEVRLRGRGSAAAAAGGAARSAGGSADSALVIVQIRDGR
jgi:hypothetical protein